MPPNIISGESSGGKHFKLVLEVTPPNVHSKNKSSSPGAPGVGLSLQSPGRKEAQFSLAGVPPVEHDCPTMPRLQASEAVHPSHVL